MYNMPLPLLVTSDKKRKTESICESNGIKLCSSQKLHVNQPLSVCASVCTSASVLHTPLYTRIYTQLSSGSGGREDPNTVVL